MSMVVEKGEGEGEIEEIEEIEEGIRKNEGPARGAKLSIERVAS